MARRAVNAAPVRGRWPLAQGLGHLRLGQFERRPHVAPGVFGVRLVEHFELLRHERAQPLRRDGLLAPVADLPAAFAVHQQRGHPEVALASRQRHLQRRGVQIRTLAQDGDFEAAHEQLAQRKPLPLVPHARAAHVEADMSASPCVTPKQPMVSATRPLPLQNSTATSREMHSTPGSTAWCGRGPCAR